MTDEERLEQRARFGLRLIMRLHQKYPAADILSVSHAFSPGEKTDADFNEGDFGGYEDKEVELASDLMLRMHDEGVISGERSGGAIYPATLPAQTRRILGTRDPNGTALLSETIRSTLDAHAGKGRVSKGEFVRMARLIDFEP